MKHENPDYSPAHRVLEIVSILTFFILTVIQTVIIGRTLTLKTLPIVSAGFFLSIFLADFISGFVHWAADTWGTPQWPIVGQSLIRPFREHHTDEKLITRHDFIETNGNNCLVCLPVLLGLFAIHPVAGGWQTFTFSLILGLTTWIFLTNQFHKWSHQDSVPKVISFLQKLRLVLPADHHQCHHQAPYLENYCITNGWMNPILTKLQFFPRLEKLITKLTGAVPRRDSSYQEAA